MEALTVVEQLAAMAVASMIVLFLVTLAVLVLSCVCLAIPLGDSNFLEKALDQIQLTPPHEEEEIN